MNKPIKTKIAILLPALRLGGAEKLIYEELKYLRKDERLDFQIHLLFEGGELYNDFADLGYPIHIWNAPHKSVKLLIVYWKISRYLKENKIDILHCHLIYKLGPIVGVLANIKKIITTVHTDIPFSWMDRTGLKQSDVILACSGSVKNNISGFYPIDRITLLNNATRLHQRNADNTKETNDRYNLSSKNIVILTLGRLITAKGYEVLIDAFSEVLEDCSNAVLLIGGDGPEREKLEAR
jgi:glycosyltransferase involved in cell wall biosynthesis